MSTVIQETAKALKENPELAAKLASTDSPEERATLLREAGLAVPTKADVEAHEASAADLSDVSGGGSTATDIFTVVNAAATA